MNAITALLASSCRATRVAVLVAAFALSALALVFSATPVSAAAGEGRCAERDTRGTNCQEGNGRRVPGGGEKASHKGWPAVTGLLWIAKTAGSREYVGTEDNDELLSHHASDTVRGGDGDDILWGDWDPKNNTTKQRDRIYGDDGDDGDDWLYASHGHNTLSGGGGKRCAKPGEKKTARSAR